MTLFSEEELVSDTQLILTQLDQYSPVEYRLLS